VVTLAAVRATSIQSRLPITLASIQNMEGVGSGCCPKIFRFSVVYSIGTKLQLLSKTLIDSRSHSVTTQRFSMLSF